MIRGLLLALLVVMLGHEAQAFYNASTGRWLSRDPMQEGGGLNLSGFVRNNPVKSHDFLGLHDRYYTLAEMDGMLAKSKFDFYNKLIIGCPSSCGGGSWDWVDSDGGKQTCSRQSCLIQAWVLTFDIAYHLRTAFAAQHRKYGNVIAFYELPPWLPVPWPFDPETINTRAEHARGQGMRWQDYDEGHGLKCQGMQSLMRKRFESAMVPMRSAGKQCFKGAEVGNDEILKKASHHWFRIYSGAIDDPKIGGVTVDPWFSAGGIISPLVAGTGRNALAKYYITVLW